MGQWYRQVGLGELVSHPEIAAELTRRLPNGVRQEFECAHALSEPPCNANNSANSVDGYDFPLAPWIDLKPFRLDAHWIEAPGGPTDEGWWIEGL